MIVLLQEGLVRPLDGEGGGNVANMAGAGSSSWWQRAALKAQKPLQLLSGLGAWQ